MKLLLNYADQYLRRSTWKDIGVIKACVFFAGIVAGTYIPKKKTECARTIALIGFVVTTVPIMTKFFEIVTDKKK